MTRLFLILKKLARRFLRRASKTSAHPVIDVFVNPRRSIVTLRERVLRIEVRLRDIPVILHRYRARITVIVAGLIVLSGTFGYIVSLRASVAHFYPASCLGNWDFVQNTLGKPDLDPNASPETFNVQNSALFTRGSSQIFCGNFHAENLTLDELRAQEFAGAKLTISWAQVVSGLSAPATTTANENIGGGAPASETTTTASSTPEQSSSTPTSTDPGDQTPASSSPSSTESTTTMPVMPEPATTTEVTPESTTTMPTGIEDVPLEPTPATTTPTSSAFNLRRPSPLGWLERFVPVAWAEPASDTISTEPTATPSSTEAPTLETTTATSSTPPVDETPPNISSTPSSTPNDSFTTPANPTLIIPSFPSSTAETSTPGTTDLSDPNTSSTDDRLEVRYSTDNETWHLLDMVPWGADLSGPLDLPISSWDELEHLQVNVRAIRAGEPDRTILVDGFGLTVQYRTPAEEPLEDPNALNQDLSDQKDFPFIEHPHFRFRYRSQQGALLQFVSRVTGLGQYQVTKATVIGPGGIELPIDPTITYDTGLDWSLDIPNTLTDIRPGRYLLRLEILEGGETYIDTKEFYWGVLAINVNKSILPLGETAYIQMAALDSMGRTQCDADLRLHITDPLGGVTSVPIDRSGQCFGDNVVDVPDYASHYVPAIAGAHRMTLENLDGNGTVVHEIIDDFDVQPEAPILDIERIGPTRIFPPARYAMHLKVTAHADFRGTLTERAPSEFIITERDIGSIVTYADHQTKAWPLDLKTGETKELWYEFKAPNISPYLYLLGPAEATGVTIIQPASTTLALVETSSTASSTPAISPSDETGASTTPSRPPLGPIEQPVTFTEARPWQVASDDPNDAWYDGGYLYRKELTIDRLLVGSSSGNHTNFPILVSFTDTVLKATSSNGHVYDPNGYDVIFTDSATSSPARWTYEVEKYVSSTGELIAWVKVPTLVTSTDTKFYIYYGNQTVSTTQESVTSTWDTNFKAVWHVKEKCSTADCMKDSTVNVNHGSPYAGYTLTDISTTTAGAVDGAIWSPQNGTQYVNARTSSIPRTNATMTMEAWAYYNSAPTTPANQNIIEMDNETNCATQLGFRGGNTLTWAWGGGTLVSMTGYPSTSVWHHFVYVRTGNNNVLYVDGTRRASTTNAVQSCAVSRMRLDTEQWTENFGGIIDEGRMSSVARSPGWILTTYNTIFKQGLGSGKFISTSSAEEQVAGDVNPTQIHYHFRFDNGVESNASSATSGVEDTPLTNFGLGTSTRLRLEVTNSGTTSTINRFRIEYAAATSGPWLPLGLSSTSTYAWLMYDSPNFSDGINTTNIATSTGGVTDTNTTFYTPNSAMKDTENQIATSTVSSTKFMEMEFSMQPTMNVTSSSYYFRVTDAGTAITTYTRYPRIDLATNLRQIHYRWRLDDDTQAAATWAAAEDTPITNIDKLNTRRLRYEISNYGAPGGSQLYRLEVSGPNPASCATTTYARVASSSDWRMATSSFFSDGDPTTNIPSGLTDENTNFVTGTIKELSDQASSTTLLGDEFTELEFSIQATASSTGGANYCFRLTNGGSTSSISYAAYATASIIPPTDATVSAVGTSTIQMFAPATNQYAGGLFAIKATAGATKTVTAITISQNGTVDGLSDLSNIKLFYEMDTSTPYTCGTKSYNGTQPQYGSTNGGGFSGAQGTSTFSGSVLITPTSTMCVYAVLDIGANATHNSDLKIAILNPANDVVLNSGTVGPGSLVSPASSTLIIRPPNLVQVHYRWRNNDGNEKGFTGTGQDGSVSISTGKSINQNVLGSLRSGQPDAIATTITSFGSSTGGLLITIPTTTGFAPGDEVLLMNLQGNSSYSSNTGKYEFQTIENITGTSSLVFATSIANIYGATSSNLDLTGQDILIQRIPQWTSLTVANGGTLTADTWNGTSGGAIAFRSTGAVTVNFGGSISADYLGYRGGTGSNTAAGGQNGESHDGFVGSGGASGAGGTSGGGAGSNVNTTSTGFRGGGGGGGGNNTGNAGNGGGGGGGGSYGAGGGGGGAGSGGAGGAGSATIGTTGGGGAGNGGVGGAGGAAGTGTTGGAAGLGARTGGGGGTNGQPAAGGGGGGLYGTSSVTTAYYGSGGGGGGGDVGSSGGAIDGQRGGGIIMAYMNSLSNSAGATGITAKGADGIAPNNGQGGGGGGAGGTILLSGTSIALGGPSIRATGGASTIGFATGNLGGGAGGGGAGRIRIQSSAITGSSTSPIASTSTTPLGTTATWALGEDVKMTNIIQGTKQRLRFLLQNAGGQTATSTAYRIQYATSTGGPWTDIPTSGSSPWLLTTSTFMTNYDRTYNLNPGLTDPASSSFRVGYFMGTSNQTPSMDINGNAFVELEYGLQSTNLATSSVSYYFRLTDINSKYGITYTNYGQAGISHPPEVSDLNVNDFIDISLTEGTSTLIYINATATSEDGYQNITYATGTLYRSGLGSGCTSDQNNCYQIPSSTCFFGTCSLNRCTVRCAAFIQFFAQPSDIGTYASDTWAGSLTIGTVLGATANATTAGVELYTLLGVGVSNAINYGTMVVNTSTGSTNQTTTLRNTGNAAINFQISGSDMTYPPRSSIIAANNQKYASSSFTYDACSICQNLSSTAQLFAVNLPKATSTSFTPSQTLYWGLFVPLYTAGAAHQGQNIFTAVLAN